MTDKCLHIFLIENDDADRMAIERFVSRQSLPYTLDYASSVVDAKEKLKKTQYDVILLDYLLADGTGLEILPFIAETPVIMITGNGAENIAVQAMRDGAYDYLIKDHERNYMTLLPATINKVLQRQKAEVDFRKSEKRYRSIVETVSDLIFQLDPERKIVFANPAFSQLGFDRKDAVGKPIDNFLYIEDKDKAHLIATQRVGARSTRNLELRFRVQSGDAQWFEMKRMSVLLDSYGIWNVSEEIVQMQGTEKQFLGTLCIARNITERKQNEDALRQSDLRTRAIMDNMPDAVVTLNEHGNIDSINLAGERIFGYRFSEITGKGFETLVSENRPAGKNPGNSANFLNALAFENQDRKPRELTGKHKDMSTFPVDLTISKMDISGQILFICTIRDTTERKTSEEKLQRFTAELARSNEELQNFAFVASHDLQEPLRKVVVFSGRLKSVCTGNLGEEADDYINRMQNACTRMQRLINDLLLYSRITTKAQPFETIDLNQIVTDVLHDLETRIVQSGGRVETEKLPTLKADRLQMQQLFQNLIANALKFHKKDIPPAVFLKSKKSANGYWDISIEDNGIGFDKKYAERIFKPFERLHGVGQYEGSGIGLAICRKIIARHGGTITVKSLPQQGSTFILTLPEKQLKDTY